MMSSYTIVYLISSILGTYAKYKFVKIFYISEIDRRRKDFLLFTCYYIIINLAYLLIDIPILNLVLNIGFMFGIALTFDSSIKRAIAMNAILVTTLTVIELITVFATGYILKVDHIITKADYHSIFGVILSNVSSYVIVVAINKYKNIRKGAKIPIHYWIALIIVPIITFYLLYIIMQKAVVSNTYLVIIAVMVLAINFTIFALYDAISGYFEKRELEIVARQLNYSYEKQLGLMKTSLKKTSSFRHDMTRHIISLRSLINASENSKAIEYLDKIDEDVSGNHMFVNSGNMVVDSVINFELSAVEKENVDLSLMIEQIPDKLKIKDYDLTILISNIVLNAVEAVRLIEYDKRISLRLEYDKSMLMLSVTNTFDGVIDTSSNGFKTRKKDKTLHGIGLSNVKAIIDKYNGET